MGFILILFNQCELSSDNAGFVSEQRRTCVITDAKAEEKSVANSFVKSVNMHLASWKQYTCSSCLEKRLQLLPLPPCLRTSNAWPGAWAPKSDSSGYRQQDDNRNHRPRHTVAREISHGCKLPVQLEYQLVPSCSAAGIACESCPALGMGETASPAGPRRWLAGRMSGSCHPTPWTHRCSHSI